MGNQAKRWENKQNVKTCHAASQSETIWVRHKTPIEICRNFSSRTKTHRVAQETRLASLHFHAPRRTCSPHKWICYFHENQRSTHKSDLQQYIFRVSFLSMRRTRHARERALLESAAHMHGSHTLCVLV
jgi:hypothetical protein